MFPTLSHFFDAIHEARIRYAVLKDWQRLPLSVEGNRPILMLVENFATLQRIAGLTQRGNHLWTLPIGREGSPTLEVVLEIYQKGEGLFPERYETEILARVVQVNGVSVPSHPSAAYAALYLFLYKQDTASPDDPILMDAHTRLQLQALCEEQVGINTTGKLKHRRSRRPFHPVTGSR